MVRGPAGACDRAVAAAVIEAWVQRFNAPVTNSLDEAIKVVVDANGDIIVTGTTDDHTADKDFLTVKYSGTSGSMLWQRRHTGSASDDVPIGLAVDANGNAVVTGRSASSFYTAKYAAADGTVLWERRTNGVAQSVAVDQNGDVLVTGYTGSFGSYDYYTAKYATVNGALLWEKSYSFSSNSADQAVAVAVDAEGNAAITGISEGKIHTLKYATADGGVLLAAARHQRQSPGNRRGRWRKCLRDRICRQQQRFLYSQVCSRGRHVGVGSTL